ncbi:membrane protein [Arthrobacter phage GlobiWarming]|nr:membrane protein [Arthrobacter phage GlobiWarming]
MTGILIFAIFVLTVFTLGAYSIVAPWWTTRAGKAYFILFVALAVLAGHFLVEELVGQLPQWVEDSVLGLVALAIAWNAYTIISKQLRFWRAARDAPTPTDPTLGGR